MRYIWYGMHILSTLFYTVSCSSITLNIWYSVFSLAIWFNSISFLISRMLDISALFYNHSNLYTWINVPTAKCTSNERNISFESQHFWMNVVFNNNMSTYHPQNIYVGFDISCFVVKCFSICDYTIDERWRFCKDTFAVQFSWKCAGFCEIAFNLSKTFFELYFCLGSSSCQ